MEEVKTKTGGILLVDDDPISNMVTEMMLEDADASTEIKIVTNGKEAIEYLEKNEANFPELILLDINMPLMGGFDFLDYWEQRGLTGNSKICLLTTSIHQRDKHRSRNYSDVIAYVEKPLTSERASQIMQLRYESTFGG